MKRRLTESEMGNLETIISKVGKYTDPTQEGIQPGELTLEIAEECLSEDPTLLYIEE